MVLCIRPSAQALKHAIVQCDSGNYPLALYGEWTVYFILCVLTNEMTAFVTNLLECMIKPNIHVDTKVIIGFVTTSTIFSRP